jgi:polysaccharide biosynthesis protein PslJ
VLRGPAPSRRLYVAPATTRWRIEWRWLLAALVLLILFVPIRRYKLALGIPFQLEPYRLAIALLFSAWCLSLVADQRVRARRSGLEAPLRLYFIAIIGSLATNLSSVTALSGAVTKTLFLLVGFLVLFYFVASVTRSIDTVDTILAALTFGGSILAVLGVLESRTGWSPFSGLERVLPFLTPIVGEIFERGSSFRAMGSAEHPIAFAALLVMITPFALYLALKRRRGIYWLAVILLALGATSSVSRTTIAMLVVVAGTSVVIKPKESLRFAPVLVPFLVAAHFATPGTLGTLRASFFGETQSNTGRTKDYGPAFEQIQSEPIFGIGYGTRIPAGPNANADILDNQWLATLIETGVVGTFALAWFFVVFIRRLGGAARASPDPESWLLLALAASVSAYAAGMFLFDAFSFIQVTLVLFLLLGLGSALVTGCEPIIARAPLALEAGGFETAESPADTLERHRPRDGGVEGAPT